MAGRRSWWPPASSLFSILHLQALMPQVGGDISSDETTGTDVEMGMGVDTEQREKPTPTTPTTAASEGSDDEERRLRAQTLVVETSAATSFPSETHRTAAGQENPSAATPPRDTTSEIHHTATTESQKDEAHTEQSQERGSQKRLYEYAKKVVSYGFVMMSALSVKTSDYFKIWAFKVSVAMFLFAFFTDILSAWLILNSLHFLTEYPIYISSVTQMLMPLFLFFSFGELHPYMIILTAALLLFSIALFHLACFQAGTTTDASKLDHIFDISAGVYALSTGSALTIAIVISEKPVAASPLACSLFLTIFVARYLMLITTLHTPGIINHAETLMVLLKLLVASTAILVAMDLLGQLLTVAVISIGSVDVVLICMTMGAHSPTTNKKHEPIDQRKDQQLLSAVMVAIPFMALTQIYSEQCTDQDSTLISATKLRMLFYFVLLLCSLNRMLISSLRGEAAPGTTRGRTAVWVLSALKGMRTSIVMVAVMDMIYKLGTGLISETVVCS